jgi:hypothetical protein
MSKINTCPLSKAFSFTLIVFCMLVFEGYLYAETYVSGDGLLRRATVKAIQRVGDDIDPTFLEVFPLPDSIKAMPISAVPKRVVSSATHWIRMIIRPEWLPQKLESEYIVVKDFKRWDKRDSVGTMFSQMIGDYVIADYKVRKHRVLLQESGATVSLRVDFPTPDSLRDPARFVKNCILRFLQFPSDKIEYSNLQLNNEGSLYYGTVLTEVGEGWPMGKDGLLEYWWWQFIRFCTDGNFFFATMMEGDGTPTPPSAKPGLPDRF